MESAEFLTVADVARQLGVKTDTVLDWIATRSLVAADVSRGRGIRARWRIERRDLEAFVASRKTVAPDRSAARRKLDPSVKQFV